MAQTIKNAITKLLDEKINWCYQEITKNTDKIFKFNDNYFSEQNNFKQYDNNGNLIIDEYRKSVKFIPCSVDSIVGSRNLMPDVFLSTINVPITMLVNVEDLDMVEEVLIYFSDITNGQIYNLQALFNNKLSNFAFSFSVDLPDMDNFSVLQGINAKTIGFMISGQLSANLFYNNNIEYYMSLDGGENYEKLSLLSAGSARVNNLFGDQLIGEENVKHVEVESSWTKTLSFITKQSRFYLDLILSIEEKNENIYKLNNVKFKTVINFNIDGNDNKQEIIKNVIISEIGYSGNYGSVVGIGLTLKEKMVSEDIPELWY